MAWTGTHLTADSSALLPFVCVIEASCLCSHACFHIFGKVQMCTLHAYFATVYFSPCVSITAFMRCYFMDVCVCWKEAQALRFHSQPASRQAGRSPRGRLPTVGTSRDDCPHWGVGMGGVGLHTRTDGLHICIHT